MLLLTPLSDRLHRAPWICFGFIGLVLLVNLMIPFIQPHGVRPAVTATLAMAAQRPYLKTPQWVDAFQTNASVQSVFPKSKPAEKRHLDYEQALFDKTAQQAWYLYSKSGVFQLGLSANSPHVTNWVTHALVIPNWLYLGLCILFIYVCGPPIEDRWGRLFFAAFLLAASVLAGAAYLMLSKNPYLSLCGAGGITAALCGVFAVRFRNQPLKVRGFSFLFPSTEMHWPSWALIPLWLVPIFGFAIMNAQLPGLWAAGVLPQIICCAAGAALAWLLQARDWEQRLCPSPSEKLTKDAHFQYQIDLALRESRTTQALAILEDAMATFPEDLSFREQYWNQAIRVNQAERAKAAGIHLIETLLQDHRLQDAHFHWLEATRHLQLEPPFPEVFCQLYRAMVRAGEPGGQDIAQFLAEHWPANGTPEAVNSYLQILDPVPQAAGIFANRVLQDGSPSAAQAPVLQAYADAMEPEDAPPKAIPISQPVYAPADLNNDFLFKPSRIQVLRKIPIKIQGLQDQKLLVNSGQGNKQLPYGKIRAIAAGKVKDISSAPVEVMDLLLDDPLEDRPFHRILRVTARLPDMHGTDGEKRWLPILLQATGHSLFGGTDDEGALTEFGSATAMETALYGIHS